MRSRELNIPNVLTLFRLLLIPVVIILMSYEKMYWAFALFIAACLTDMLDGYIARHYNQITKLGTWLDPMADKFMSVAVLITFTVLKVIPLFVVLVVAGKEFMMLLGGLILLKKGIVVPSNKYGKVAAFLLYVSIASAFFAQQFAPYYLWAIYISLAMVVIAFVQYAVANIGKIFAPKDKSVSERQ